MPDAPILDVLVVDDEPLARDLVAGIVEELACVRSVSCCKDGREAIPWWAAST